MQSMSEGTVYKELVNSQVLFFSCAQLLINNSRVMIRLTDYTKQRC